MFRFHSGSVILVGGKFSHEGLVLLGTLDGVGMICDFAWTTQEVNWHLLHK